jgi:arabinofuranosyltransferase
VGPSLIDRRRKSGAGAASRDHPPGPAAVRFLSVLLGALLFIVLAWHAFYYLPFLSDDALISLRYSQRLLHGHGLTWTEGKAVEGYSNLLWVLLAALMGALGFDLVDGVRVLGYACMLGAFAGVIHAHRPRDWPRALPALAGGLALALAAPVAIWTIGGLEQPLMMLLLIWALVLCYPIVEGGAVSTASAQVPGVLLGLLCLTRPDGVLFTAAIAAAILAGRGLSRSSLRIVALLSLLPAAACAGQLGFRLAYYGTWVPNTALVKASFSWKHFEDGLGYLRRGLPAQMPLIAAAAVAAIFGLAHSRRRPRVILLGMVIVAWMAYVALIAGDICPGWRHFLPMLAGLALLLAAGASWFLEWVLVSSKGGRSFRAATGAALILLAGFFGVYLTGQMSDAENRRAREERWEWDGRAIGRMLKSGFEASRPLLAVDTAGCLPYWSELPALDMMGLNDEYIPHHPPASFGQGWIGHELGDGEYVLGRRPDLVVFCTPHGSAEACFRSGKQMQKNPRFAEEYTLATFKGEGSSEVLSRIWVRRLSPRIGIRRDDREVVVPAYLLNSDPDSFVELDSQGRFHVGIRRWAPAIAAGVPLPAGSWRVDVDSSAEVEVVVTAAGQESGPVATGTSLSTARIAVRLETDVDLALKMRHPGEVRVRGVTFTRIGDWRGESPNQGL